MERTADIYIDEIIVILGKSGLEVSVEDEAARIDNDVDSAHFLDYGERHFVLLQVDGQVALDHKSLSGELLSYVAQSFNVSTNKSYFGTVI